MILKKLKDRIFTPKSWGKLASYSYLQKKMSNYQVKHLVNEKPQSFRKKINKFLNLIDYQMEGYKDLDKQRDLSIKFHWGHNHDFGSFKLEGRMKDRHIFLPVVFIDKFKVLPRKLDNKKVLDVGCWTGGTSLLLTAMGADVTAIEEVKKYVECVNYLKQAFDIKNLEAKNLSIYECNDKSFQNQFDFALFTGVLYHLTDPILALRIIFNSIKDDGYILLETAAVDSDEPILSYKGPTVFQNGKKKELNRSGWNWFFPSPVTLKQMMQDVGFKEVEISELIGGRVFAIGKRVEYVDMLRAGLSVKNIN